MIKINFAHLDNSIQLEEKSSNILVIESSSVYAKVMYSLHNETEYFRIYSDDYSIIPRNKIMLILNPLLYDFDDRTSKEMLYRYILNQMKMDGTIKLSYEAEYQELIQEMNRFLETVLNLDFSYNADLDMKALLKFLGVSINQDEVASVFDKVQLLLKVIKELEYKGIVIFMNLNTILTSEEYKFVLEQIELQRQTVLIIESNIHNLKGLSYYCLDEDFFLRKV